MIKLLCLSVNVTKMFSFSPASFTLTVYSSSSAIRYSVPCNVLLGGCGLCSWCCLFFAVGKGHNLLEACLGHIWLSYQVEKLLTKLSQSCHQQRDTILYFFKKWILPFQIRLAKNNDIVLNWVITIMTLENQGSDNIHSTCKEPGLTLLYLGSEYHWLSSDSLPVF